MAYMMEKDYCHWKLLQEKGTWASVCVYLGFLSKTGIQKFFVVVPNGYKFKEISDNLNSVTNTQIVTLFEEEATSSCYL